MQSLTSNFNDLAQQRRDNLNNRLFWLIVLWIIIADDDRASERERKHRLNAEHEHYARQNRSRISARRENQRHRFSGQRPAPKPPAP